MGKKQTRKEKKNLLSVVFLVLFDFIVFDFSWALRVCFSDNGHEDVMEAFVGLMKGKQLCWNVKICNFSLQFEVKSKNFAKRNLNFWFFQVFQLLSHKICYYLHKNLQILKFIQTKLFSLFKENILVMT